MTEKFLYVWWAVIQNLAPVLKPTDVVPCALPKQQHCSDTGKEERKVLAKVRWQSGINLTERPGRLPAGPFQLQSRKICWARQIASDKDICSSPRTGSYMWQSTRKQTVIFFCHMGVRATCVQPACHLFAAWVHIIIIAGVYLSSSRTL